MPMIIESIIFPTINCEKEVFTYIASSINPLTNSTGQKAYNIFFIWAINLVFILSKYTITITPTKKLNISLTKLYMPEENTLM